MLKMDYIFQYNPTQSQLIRLTFIFIGGGRRGGGGCLTGAMAPSNFLKQHSFIYIDLF